MGTLDACDNDAVSSSAWTMVVVEESRVLQVSAMASKLDIRRLRAGRQAEKERMMFRRINGCSLVSNKDETNDVGVSVDGSA